ncbi:Uncharacterized protein DBV15_11188 [Temnothorax longispinosus]|uniref:Cytochrome P450 4C1 n=1 Tax=Temnothorax longispinosus TaxID=300112 RepID=A0A4S2KEZ0_9HYME|nr:Uncharacterized protein DBV15_11188 [Temnothorax longispinosus]
MIITTLLLLFLIALVYNYYVHHRKNGRLINLIPGIPEEYWKLMTNISDEYYSIFKIWVFFTPYVLIRHPDDLKAILNSAKHIDKSGVYHVLHRLVGTGLSTSKGAKWHSRRNILAPLFHFNILQQFVEILFEQSENMTKSLKDIRGAVVKDSVSFVSEYTLNALCETTMGTSLQDLGAFQQRIMKPWLQNNWIFSLTPKGREQTKILKIIHGFTEQIIAERKLYHERTNDRYLKTFDDTSIEADEAETIGIRRKRLAMLDFLIVASREGLMTDLDIREEVDTFTFSDRVRNEVDTALQKNKEKFTMKLLQDLPYLDRCIKEALRLYPSMSVISRILAEDVKLQSYLVPAGTFVFLNIYGVHRDPNFWPNPEVFDPNRFLPEKILNRHPYSYLPFSAGPRNCIGQQFAMLEMKAMIAPLIHNFCLEPVDYLKNLRIEMNITLCPAHPLRVRFVPVCKIDASI